MTWVTSTCVGTTDAEVYSEILGARFMMESRLLHSFWHKFISVDIYYQGTVLSGQRACRQFSLRLTLFYIYLWELPFQSAKFGEGIIKMNLTVQVTKLCACNSALTCMHKKNMQTAHRKAPARIQTRGLVAVRRQR